MVWPFHKYKSTYASVRIVTLAHVRAIANKLRLP